MQPRLFLATRTLRGRLSRYAESFNFLEVRASDGVFPKQHTLRRWRSSVPDDFRFIVVVPESLLESTSDRGAADKMLKGVVRHLGASGLLIPTPASMRPTAKNKDRLVAFAERWNKLVPMVAWDPAGMWDEDEAKGIAKSLEWLLVADPARDALADGPLAYGRIRGLGEGARLSPRRLQLVIENLRVRQEAYIVIETDNPGSVARDLRGFFSSGEVAEEGDGPMVFEPEEQEEAAQQSDGEQEE